MNFTVPHTQIAVLEGFPHLGSRIQLGKQQPEIAVTWYEV